MMKHFNALTLTMCLLLFVSSINLFAQDAADIKIINGKKYMAHKVAVHEYWYALARKYKTTFQELKAANPTLTGDLAVGQIIYVPYKESATAQQKETTADTVSHKTKTPSVKKTKKDSIASVKKDTTVSAKPIASEVPAKVSVGDTIKKKLSRAKRDSIAASKKHSAISSEKKTEKITGVMSEKGIASWIDDENINPDKYFALHGMAPIGTIIRVTNLANGKIVYVKVVGVLPETSDNDNLLIKITHTAGAKLETRDVRFQVELSYGIGE